MKQIAVAIFSLNTGRPLTFGIKVPVMLQRTIFILLLLLLVLAEFFRIYLVMPYPGSQQSETVEIAYGIEKYIFWIRLFVLLVAGVALVRVFRQGRLWEKILLPLFLAGYISLFYLFNFRFDAESKFHLPSVTSFIPVAESVDNTKLVIGIVVNGEAKAYPIQLIGYHHQVRDTVGGEPLFITYCTVCRTGRVYSTLVEGQHTEFRLVGMDHYNAVFEDKATHTWWQQANGQAVAGPLKGSSLREIPSQQLSIDAWARQYPASVVMAPDSKYDDPYFRLEDYDRGTMQSSLVRRDYRSWQPKSWIIGVKNESAAIAYDWNDLVKKRLIQDSLKSLPLLVAMETDTTTFHVYDRRINGLVLEFGTANDITKNNFKDTNTSSLWNMDGYCIAGPLKGKQLTRVQAYNEFWHSWSRFQQNPKRYLAEK